MNTIVNSIRDLLSNFLLVATMSAGLLLFAGEIRLASLRKASQGTGKLSAFTAKMTSSRGPMRQGRSR